MTKEQRVLLQALGCYMQKKPFCPTEQNVDWVVFFREAWLQSVTLPLVEFLPVFQENGGEKKEGRT